jgi:hypothetical protein
MVLSVRSGNEIPKHAMKNISITKAKKGMHVMKKSIPEEEFQKCFEQWKYQLTKCIGAQGDYFEGDSNH